MSLPPSRCLLKLAFWLLHPTVHQPVSLITVNPSSQVLCIRHIWLVFNTLTRKPVVLTRMPICASGEHRYALNPHFMIIWNIAPIPIWSLHGYESPESSRRLSVEVQKRCGKVSSKEREARLSCTPLQTIPNLMSLCAFVVPLLRACRL